MSHGLSLGAHLARVACTLVLVQNFFPSPIMVVEIGTQACTSITITDVDGLGEFTCSAPPGPGTGIVQLRVDIDSGSATTQFLYDAPNVTGLVGVPCDAATPCPLVVRGLGSTV